MNTFLDPHSDQIKNARMREIKHRADERRAVAADNARAAATFPDPLRTLISSQSRFAQQVFHIIYANPMVNTPTLVQLLGVSTRKVSGAIHELKTANLIMHVGSDKTGGYVSICH